MFQAKTQGYWSAWYGEERTIFLSFHLMCGYEIQVVLSMLPAFLQNGSKRKCQKIYSIHMCVL